MSVFHRGDGRDLRVVEGFRELALGYRPGKSPRPSWTEEDYRRAADARHTRSLKRVAELSRFSDFEGARLLEVGCGAGLDCVGAALQGAKRVVGLDIDLSLFRKDEKGDMTRRLMGAFLEAFGREAAVAEELERLGVAFGVGDVTRLPFPDGAFDLLWSRSALEHMIPLDAALEEMSRVLAPGGVAYHIIDPYYWLRGCHKRAVVDVPWAHARLSNEEFESFVREREGEEAARKRLRRLETLNPFTIERYRQVIDESPFEVLDWVEARSPFAEEVLAEHPDVLETLLPGVGERDLVTSRVSVWLRRADSLA